MLFPGLATTLANDADPVIAGVFASGGVQTTVQAEMSGRPGSGRWQRPAETAGLSDITPFAFER
ncbi:hypothetical protein KV697_09400 [Sphingomonas sanguinis]|uniref:hypothetical protein n=1 Tax=Sphingomonas sanguinis TaxID=33051 RepID=UPI001C566644|nr:hypothetical protein [Sphingomonas sanguinis]QXT37457.1 hypothetical protein KV697_09400 [Sphingomonas sanguinis]